MARLKRLVVQGMRFLYWIKLRRVGWIQRGKAENPAEKRPLGGKPNQLPLMMAVDFCIITISLSEMVK